MSFSPLLCAATLSCEGVRVDSFKPLHNDALDQPLSAHYQPLKNLYTRAALAKLKKALGR